METSAAWAYLQPDSMESRLMAQQHPSSAPAASDPTLPPFQTLPDGSFQDELLATNLSQSTSPVFDLLPEMDSVFDMESNPFVAGMPNANTTLLGDSFLMKSPLSPQQDLNDMFDMDFPHRFDAEQPKSEKPLDVPIGLDVNARFTGHPLQLNTLPPFALPCEAPESDLAWSLSSPESQRGFGDDAAGFLDISGLDEALAQPPAESFPAPSPPKADEVPKPYQTRKRKDSTLAATTLDQPAAVAKDDKTDAPAPRKRRTRRSKPLTEELKRQKHERFLANNREAACKCRQKKKLAENKLVDDAKSLEAAVEMRRMECFQLQNELEELKKEWAKHQNCSHNTGHRASAAGAVEMRRSNSPESSSAASDSSPDDDSARLRAKSLPLELTAAGLV